MNSDVARTGAAPGALRRLLAGLPSALADLLMAAGCLLAWWSPERLPDDLLQVTALVMLIEFLSIHSMIMLPIIAVLLAGRWPRAALPLSLMLYVGMAAGLSLALGTWWPTLLFGWLLLSRYVLPLWNLGGEPEHLDAGKLWVVSTLLWLALVFATLILPVPALGWDAATAARVGLPGEGIWVDEPQRLLAFAVSYFLLLALYKLRAAPQPDTPSTPERSPRSTD